MVKLLVFILSFLFIVPSITLAQEKNQFITIVNPVRISAYSSNPSQSLINQYQLIKGQALPASWLFTYDAISEDVVKVIKSFDGAQDIGIWLEVTENFSNQAGVNYNKTDSWHRANSVFLSGYSQSDRVKLIDTVFSKFKDELGYYPKSVGAWWIDSYSLEYMQLKYKISANLVVSDQLETDGYTVWGQFWGAPYYPSKKHAAIPAQNLEKKLDLVNIQWAPRDPINGYISPSNHRASLYSTQDYFTIGLSDEYLDKLINLYAKKNENDFGQITFGLEGDFKPESYLKGGQFEKYISTAKKFAGSGEFIVLNMKQFSDWYRKNFSLTPSYLIESDDLLGKNQKIIRYQTRNYRIALLADKSLNSIKVIDLKVYQNNFQEPFFISTNKQLDLYIKIPSVIDTATSPDNYIEFKNTNLVDFSKNSDNLKVLFDKNRSIEFEVNKINFKNFTDESLAAVKSPFLKIVKSDTESTFLFKESFPFNEEGYIFRDLTTEASYFLSVRKITFLGLIFGVIILVGYKFSPRKVKLTLFPLFFIFVISVGTIWYFYNSENYSVSQSEIDALLKLKSLPSGKVLVLDKDCLQCHWETRYKPAIFINKRYVTKISNKTLVLDKSLIESQTDQFFNLTQIKKEDSAKYLKSLNVAYIYLVKHEDYQEKVPYSPGDLGLEQVFINSDAQIWKVKK